MNNIYKTRLFTAPHFGLSPFEGHKTTDLHFVNVYSFPFNDPRLIKGKNNECTWYNTRYGIKNGAFFLLKIVLEFDLLDIFFSLKIEKFYMGQNKIFLNSLLTRGFLPCFRDPTAFVFFRSFYENII